MTNEQVHACESIGLEMGAKGAMCSRENVRIILESDVDALMDVWFDEASKTYRSGEVSNSVETTIPEVAELFRDHVSAKYGVRMGKWTDKFIHPEITRFLWNNSRDGLKEAMEDFIGLHSRDGEPWDGVERIEPFFKTLFGDDWKVGVDWYMSAFRRFVHAGTPVSGLLVVRTHDRVFTDAVLTWLFGIHPHVLSMWNCTPLAPASMAFDRVMSSSAIVRFDGIKPTTSAAWKLGMQSVANTDEIRLPYDREVRKSPRRCAIYSLVDEDFEHPSIRTVDWHPVGLDPKIFMREVVEIREDLAAEALSKLLRT